MARALSSIALVTALCAATGCQGQPADDLSEAQLSRVVDEQRPSLESCYNAALDKTPYKNEVRMGAIIHIAPSGAVDDVEVEGSGLPEMPACIRQAIARWRFPPAREATHTRLPIVFSPQVVKTPKIEP